MKPSLFRRRPFRNQTIDEFVNLVQRCQMTYWASDLLSKKLKPEEIRQAVRRAMTACKRSGVDVRQHFQLMYTSSNRGVSFDDCRMSKLGYNLTLLNANPNNGFVAAYQMKLVDPEL